jgi:3-dehydroquinate dehydratase-2
MNKTKFAIINGPNLNLLGTRETSIYGDLTLDGIKKHTHKRLESDDYDIELDWFQSNIEGELVDKIQSLVGDESISGLIINPAAYSHTSIAILDALKILEIPVVEVHISNTHLRDEFRQTKITAKASKIVMEGLGKEAYYIAIISQLLD